MTNVIVSGAKSRSHLIYIASYLRTLDPVHHALNVYFLPLPPFLHADAVTVDDARAFFPAEATVSEGLESWHPDDATLYVCVGAPGIRTLSALVKTLGLDMRSLRIVVTDEGIGSYGDFRTAVAARRRQGASLPVAATKSALGVGLRSIPARRWATYRKTAGQWAPDVHVMDEFDSHVQDPVPRSNTAVILTQPFVDMGLIDESIYLNYVRDLAQAAENNGLSAMVRPHPAERPGRYENFILMDGSGTAELDPRVLSAAICLGGPSTALVNLAAMRHMPVVWSSAPGLEFLDTDVSRAQQGIFRTFLRAPVPPRDVADAIGHQLGG